MYERGRGIELGASFDFRWKAAVSMEGEARVSGTIFSPPEITALRMGVRGELFGRGVAAEVDLVSWRP
jgi:hypothetical protein